MAKTNRDCSKVGREPVIRRARYDRNKAVFECSECGEFGGLCGCSSGSLSLVSRVR
jgi:hypothetical protein